MVQPFLENSSSSSWFAIGESLGTSAAASAVSSDGNPYQPVG